MQTETPDLREVIVALMNEAEGKRSAINWEDDPANEALDREIALSFADRICDAVLTALAATLPQRLDAAIERFHDSIIAWMDTRTTDLSLACDAAERELRSLLAVASRAEVTDEMVVIRRDDLAELYSAVNADLGWELTHSYEWSGIGNRIEAALTTMEAADGE